MAEAVRSKKVSRKNTRPKNSAIKVNSADLNVAFTVDKDVDLGVQIKSGERRVPTIDIPTEGMSTTLLQFPADIPLADEGSDRVSPVLRDIAADDTLKEQVIAVGTQEMESSDSSAAIGACLLESDLIGESPPPTQPQSPYTGSVYQPSYSELRHKLSSLQIAETEIASPVSTKTEDVPTAPPMFDLAEEEEEVPAGTSEISGVDIVSPNADTVVEATVAACRPRILHRKIVSLLVDPVVRPFTEAQLKALYRNVELEANEQFIEDFVAKNLQLTNHEFWELVAGYLRSRVALLSCTRTFEELRRDHKYRVDRVWDTVDDVVKGTGLCLDNTLVRGEHRYLRAVYSAKHSAELQRLQTKMRCTLHESHALHAYELVMSRLQVEAYLHRLLKSIPGVDDIPRNAPILVYVDGRDRPPMLSAHIEDVKRCVAILFSFQRKPLKDAESLQDIRTWLTQLVSVILRLGTFDDHLFLLNHVLRCPAGIRNWAVVYVQVPLPTSVAGHFTIHDTYLDHVLTVLATILLPIRAREDFLRQFSIEASMEFGDEQHWVMVDSEGEEDEDPTNCWLHWRENDLVSLLNQIPIGSVFRCLLCIQSKDGVDHYDVCSMTDCDLINVFAFATHLIHLLRIGLKTFHLARYRQFTKRLSQMIRHTVLYVSDHCKLFLSANPHLPAITKQRLQQEHDQFFLRAVYSIYFSQCLGAWQFVAAMPYDCVSVEMLWKILWLLHMDQGAQLDAVEDAMVANDWQQKLSDVRLRQAFEEKLSKMPPGEAFYLLTAFANIACSRTSQESDIIETICWEIFQISFLEENTKEQCSKWGRELLFTISKKHPFVISLLLDEVRLNMEKLGKISIYLFSELPVYLWLPSVDDVNVIELWLTEHPPSSIENRLTRVILTAMNWDFNEQGHNLFLDVGLHRRIALAVVQSYRKHCSSSTGGFVAERFKQVAAVALKKDVDPEECFSTWAWEIVVSLRLHVHQQPLARLLDASVDTTVPNFDDPVQLGEISWSFRQKHPLAIFVVFAMTNVGHNIMYFCEKLEYLLTLVELQYFEAALHLIGLVTPFFFSCGHYLWSNKRFMAAIQGILNCDVTYMKMAKSLVFTQFCGRILQCFAGLIEYQIQTSSKVGWDVKCLLHFWTEMLTGLPLWYKNQSALHLLDVIFRAAFHENVVDLGSILAKKFQFYSRDCDQKVSSHLILFCSPFRVLLTSEAASQSAGGSFTSFVSWLATGSGVPFTFVSKNVGSQFVWFSYYSLEAEVESDVQVSLWKNTLRQLAANSSLTPEAALRKAASQSDGASPMPVRHLPIYRWAELVLVAPSDHPLLPLLWQKFFVLFLQRVPLSSRSGGTLMDSGSVSERFFSSAVDLPLFKKLKRRLDELTDGFTKATLEPIGLRDSGPSSAEPAEESDSEIRYRCAALNNKLSRIYRTLYLWLEEPRLHDPSPHLPSLPADYEPNRLLMMFQDSQERWVEFVNMDRIQSERLALFDAWCGRSPQMTRRPGWKIGASQTATFPADEARVEEIIKRLQSYEAPLSAPCIPPLKSVVPSLDVSNFDSQSSFDNAVRPHLKVLVNYASQFSLRVANHSSLDRDYVELLPRLYLNVDAEVRLKVRCSRGEVDDNHCLGPALIVFKFKEKKIDVSMEEVLEQNRSEWRHLLSESLLGPPINVCSSAIFVENAVSDLLKRYHPIADDNDDGDRHDKLPTTVDVRSAARLRNLGIGLFYHVCNLLHGEIELYRPTHQLLTWCINILGKELFQKKGDQCDNLLDLMLKRRRLVDMLAPHFCPNAANVDVFAELYKRVTQIHRENGADLAFVLLTKFNVKFWLETCQPRSIAQEKVVNSIGEGLFSLGHEPPPELSGIGELYRRHLTTVLLHQFPNMYRNVFALLVAGTDSRLIATDVWYDVLNALMIVDGYGEQCEDKLTPDSSIDAICSMCRSFAQRQRLFSSQLILETLLHLSNTYSQKRISTKDVLLKTLYKDYESYWRPILVFIGLMGHAYVASFKRESSSSTNCAELGDPWDVLKTVFAPWTLPVRNLDRLWLPWVDGLGAEPFTAVTLFGSCVQYANATLYGVGSFLSAFLEMYAAELAVSDVKEYVLTIWHDVFIRLPWTTFWPDLRSICVIMSIMNSGKSECLAFLGRIFVQIGWPQVVQHIVQQETAITVHQTMDCLLQLYVCLGLQADVDRTAEMVTSLASAQTHPWETINSKSYERALKWFLTGCDPVLILQESPILSLLRSAAEFVPGIGRVTSEVTAKRTSYVRTCVQLLCECAVKNKTLIRTRMELFKDVVLSLLKETEVVLVTGPDTFGLFDMAVALVTEIMNVMNVASVTCLQDLAMKALQDWARAHPRSPIFGAVLHVTFRNLASVAHMAALTEWILESYFSIDVDLCIAGNGWTFLLSVLEIPRLTEDSLVAECIECGHFLTLKAIAGLLLGNCKNVDDHHMVITRVIDWLDKARPTDENEHKLLLLWSISLEGIVRMHNSIATCDVVKLFASFANVVQPLSEDKSSQGFWATFGLGRKSPLSPRFRFASRCVTAFAVALARKLDVDSDPTLAKQLQSAVALLESTKTNRQYADYREHLDRVLEYVHGESCTLHHAASLLSYLTRLMYPGEHCLSIIVL